MKSHCLVSISERLTGHLTRSFAFCAILLGLSLAPAISRAGQAATPPRSGNGSPSTGSMLQSARRNVSNSLQALLPRASTSRGCLEGIKRLSEERRTAQRVIAADYPLDEMVGIVLADSYDALFVAAVDTLTQAFLLHDKELPETEAGGYFTEKLSDLPTLNETPASFIVAFVIMRCVQVAQTTPGTMSPALREAVGEVAVRAVAAVAQKYRESRNGSDARQKADEFWQASVIDRVRCKTHQSQYVVQELRNGMRKDGSFYRRYAATCQVGHENRSFDFDLEALNQLTRSGGVQELPSRLPTPESRQPGVDQQD